MKPPLSLSMLKMEKNFIAVNEKRYPRKPYEDYPIFDSLHESGSLMGFVIREQRELLIALDILFKSFKNFDRERIATDYSRARRSARPVIQKQIIAAMWEVADVSNTLDYLFEGLIQALKTWEGEI